MSAQTRYLAHSANDKGNGVAEPLSVHLQAVAERAAEYATCFGASEQAYAAGLLHDLGKYSAQFLRRLSDPREPGRDHSSVGALAAASAYKALGIMPALAIEGHHVGLREIASHKDLSTRIATAFKGAPDSFTEVGVPAIQKRFSADGFAWPKVTDGLRLHGNHASDMLDARMLFSALVDADFIETEAHFDGDATTPRRERAIGPSLDVDLGVLRLRQHVERIRANKTTAPLDHIRAQLLKTCIEQGETQPTGLFTLSAPTGAGKTLAMLAFALHHARQHSLRRIVLVMPFLSIIEQTARSYRSIFSTENGFAPNTVVEHHSLATGSTTNPSQRDDGVTNLRRLLAENWDAPIILTTSVQCLESLMANRPSPCRKLHRLARSVILFDEVQTLPPPLAVATLATLSRLADPAGPYRSSVVFATATQPAFEVLNDRVTKLTSAGWQPHEIVENPKPMFQAAAQRVQVCWRHTPPIGLDDLAAELVQHERVLCVLNLKRHAVELAKAIEARAPRGLFHLSTNMCPAHRTAVLRDVRRRLSPESQAPVRLNATQCVEAGVDIDFPLVYRALGPLEAIAQAAGRCNRHGMRETGRVIVFLPRDERSLYPPGYAAATDATEGFLNALVANGTDLDSCEIINDPKRLVEYFRQFYGKSRRGSQMLEDERLLLEAIEAGNFPDVAREYRLIKSDTINVLVPYDRLAFSCLCEEVRTTGYRPPGFARDWIRRAAPHAVSLFRPRNDDESILAHLEPIHFGSRPELVASDQTTCYIAAESLPYEMMLGLASPGVAPVWIA